MICKISFTRIVFAAIILFATTACTSTAKITTETAKPTSPITEAPPSPTLTSTITPNPTQTFTPTTPPTSTPTPFLVYPVPYGTSIPGPLSVITADNILDLKQLYVLGNGYISDSLWSSDGNYFAITSTIGTYLYDSFSFQQLLFVPFQSDSLSMLTPEIDFSNDNQYFSVTSDENVLVYNLLSLDQEPYISPEIDAKTIKILPDNSSIAVCLANGTVDLYDFQNDKKILSINFSQTEEAHRCNVQISGDGRTLAWRYQAKLYIWNMQEKTLIHEIDVGPYDYDFAISKNGSTLAVQVHGGFYPNTKFVDTKTGFVVSILQQHTISSYSQTSDILVTIPNDATKQYSDHICSGEINLWNLSERKFVRAITGSTGYKKTALNPIGNKIAASFSPCAYNNNDTEKIIKKIKIWNTETGDIIGEYSTDPLTFDLDNLSLSMDNQIIGIGSGDGEPEAQRKIFLWKEFGELPVQPLKRNESDEYSISFEDFKLELKKTELEYPNFIYSYPTLLSPNSKYEVSRGENGYELKNKDDGSLIVNLGIRCVAGFSKNSDLLFLFQDYRQYKTLSWIEIWDLNEGKYLPLLYLQTGNPKFLQFSPDGTFFITISDDETLRIWGIDDK